MIKKNFLIHDMQKYKNTKDCSICDGEDNERQTRKCSRKSQSEYIKGMSFHLQVYSSKDGKKTLPGNDTRKDLH